MKSNEYTTCPRCNTPNCVVFPSKEELGCENCKKEFNRGIIPINYDKDVQLAYHINKSKKD